MKERVFKVFSQVMKVPVETIHEDSSPSTVNTWDSLKHMKIILSLEEEFGVRFSDEEIVEMLSVESIIKTLNKKI